MADEKENKVAESPEGSQPEQKPVPEKTAQAEPAEKKAEDKGQAAAKTGDVKAAPKPDSKAAPKPDSKDPKAADKSGDVKDAEAKATTEAKGEDKAPAKAASKPAEKKEAPAKKPAAKKKAKPPKLEDKPFNEFMKEHYLPELEKVLAEQGIEDLPLSFVKEPVAVGGLPGAGLCSQVVGNWFGGDREFRVYFPKDDIKSIKTFSYAEVGSSSSILESFLIDERKVTLDLLVSGVVLRLQAQKWIGRN